MSTIVVPDIGERGLLNKALDNGENLLLKLFTAVSPAIGESTVAGDFTEATFSGATAKTLTSGSWNAASTSTGTSSKTYAAQTFTHGGAAGTGSQTILGYYVVGATSGNLYWCETFDVAKPIAGGDQLTITPRLEAA